MEGVGDGKGDRGGGFVDRKGLLGLAVAVALVVVAAVRTVRSRSEPWRETGIAESVRGLEDLLRSELWLDAIDSLMVVMDAADTNDNNGL